MGLHRSSIGALKRTWVVGLLIAWGLALPALVVAEEWPYYEPALGVVLLDLENVRLPAPLHEQLPKALLGVARNFQGDPAVPDRLRTMAMAVVLQLDPRRRDALIVNHQLRRGLPPKVRGDYQSRERVTTILQATRAVLKDESDPDLVILLAMLDDVASVWMDDETLRPTTDPWQQTVPPVKMVLSNSSARLRLYQGNKRNRYSVEASASGRVTPDSDFSVILNGKAKDLPALQKRVTTSHPFLGPHLELALRWPTDWLHEDSTRPEIGHLLAHQLFSASQWPNDWIWFGGADDRADERLLGSRATLHALGSYRDSPRSRYGVKVVVIPHLPEAVLRDWVVFGRLDLMKECQVISVHSIAELLALRPESSNPGTFVQAKALLAQEKPRKAEALLRKMVQDVPNHVSAKLLLERLTLAKTERGSYRGSLRELTVIAWPYLNGDRRDFRVSDAKGLCQPSLDRLREMAKRFHLKSKPLADQLEKLIENEMQAYCLNPHKSTATGRRQYTKMRRQFIIWQQALRHATDALDK